MIQRAPILGSGGLSEVRIQRQQAADTNAGKRPIKISRQSQPRQGVGADPAGHEGIHEAHRHVADLAEHDWPGELESVSQFGAQGDERTIHAVQEAKILF